MIAVHNRVRIYHDSKIICSMFIKSLADESIDSVKGQSTVKKIALVKAFYASVSHKENYHIY